MDTEWICHLPSGDQMEKCMKKTLWVGIVNNQIGFFTANPNGNVEGLQGSRKFHVEGGNLTDDNGNNVVDNTAVGGLNSESGSDTIVQTGDQGDQSADQGGQASAQTA
jgi:hypothetical protein